MKVLVIGRSGQVAQALRGVGGESVRCVGRPEIDLTDRASINRVIFEATEDIVINAAAYTSVDGAESNVEEAYLLNETGPLHLAEACRARGLPLIHLSTDCVFDGELDRAYTPDDLTCPIGAYGRSKLAGEVAVREVWEKSLIVRVSWIFSQYADSFVSAMLRLAQTRDEVTVVADQYGCPTYALDLSEGLLKIANICLDANFLGWGIYHLAGAGELSRAEQAGAVYKLSASLNGPTANVVPVKTADFPTPARRPLNARLSIAKTTQTFGVSLRPWEEGLALTVPAIIKDLAVS